MSQILEKTKVFVLSLIPAALVSYFGVLAIPFGLLVAANVLDYLTGLAAAPSREQVRNSSKGWRGILKKVLMWLLVAVGVIVDAVLMYTAETLGWEMPFKFMVACVVCLWQLANELISILENMNDAGVPVPGFLMKIIEWIRKGAEDEGGGKEE